MAVDTLQTRDNVADLHPTNEHRHTLRVAVAAAYKLDTLDRILLQLHNDGLRADSFCGIYYLFAHIV